MKKKVKFYLKNIICILAVIILIIIARNIYTKYNFYDYQKGVRLEGKTTFLRDSKVRYSDMHSYKIVNNEYNDAMIYKTIQVTPNTAYKVSCMVKTEDVTNLNNIYTGGAQISINNTTKSSKALTGTNDWTQLTLMFNSNSSTSIEIGFRLGGYEEYGKGTAWFSDFKIEEGSLDSDTNWKMACFLVKNIDVDIKQNGKKKNVKFNMSNDDISCIRQNMERLKNTITDISGDNMKIDYDIIEIDTPLNSLSYDEENEYYVSPNDINPLIKEYVDENEYDYIYVAVRLGDLNKNNIVLVHDWIGLRSYGI